jgi:hypothetical protein
MSTTFNWTVTAMDCYPQADGRPDVVFNVHWTCSGVDDGCNGAVYATCQVPEPGATFTPYANLTQNQVLNWIWANGVDKTATEDAVQSQIDNAKNPPVVTPALPWSH